MDINSSLCTVGLGHGHGFIVNEQLGPTGTHTRCRAAIPRSHPVFRLPHPYACPGYVWVRTFAILGKYLSPSLCELFAIVAARILLCKASQRWLSSLSFIIRSLVRSCCLQTWVLCIETTENVSVLMSSETSVPNHHVFWSSFADL